MILFQENDIHKIIPSPPQICDNFDVKRYVERLREWATFRYKDALNCLVDFCELVCQGYQLAFDGKIEYSYLRDTLCRARAIILTHFIYLQEESTEEDK